MKKQIGQRILSLVLVLVMVLGMVPVTLNTRAEAVSPEEQTTAEALLQKINTMETNDFPNTFGLPAFMPPMSKTIPLQNRP